MSIEAPNKSQIVALPLALGNFATTTGARLETKQVQAFILTIVLANKLGTVTFTPFIDRVLKDGTTWIRWWTAAAALSANGSAGYMFGRGGGGTITGAVEKIEQLIPFAIRVGLTVTGAGDGNEFDTYAELDMLP